jgi:hypothetical protein
LSYNARAERFAPAAVTEKDAKNVVLFHDQTFSRCGSELKMHSRLFAELKIDMLNTSIGSPNRLRRQPVRPE